MQNFPIPSQFCVCARIPARSTVRNKQLHDRVQTPSPLPPPSSFSRKTYDAQSKRFAPPLAKHNRLVTGHATDTQNNKYNNKISLVNIVLIPLLAVILLPPPLQPTHYERVWQSHVPPIRSGTPHNHSGPLPPTLRTRRKRCTSLNGNVLASTSPRSAGHQFSEASVVVWPFYYPHPPILHATIALPPPPLYSSCHGASEVPRSRPAPSILA